MIHADQLRFVRQLGLIEKTIFIARDVATGQRCRQRSFID